MQDPPLVAAGATTFLPNPTIFMAAEPSAEQPQLQLKCPRCDSTNTKFCYYNNYNLSQPRHFCKNCRRYWTNGGALRNVPVGGGTRKNSKRSSSSSSTATESPNPKRPAPDPSPVLKPEPVSALYPPPPPIEAADDKMLEITGSFSSLLQSTGQFGNLNFLDGFDSPGGGGDGSGAVSRSDSGEPNGSGENPNPDRQSQQPAESFLGWAGGWPDLAIYTSPGSSFR